MEVTFPFAPDFNQAVAIQPDGYVTLRELGDVHISELTLPEVRQMLTARYGTILKSPEIDVSLKDFEKPYFIADGQVGHPGKYELHGPTTVTQGLAMAGGLTEASKHSQVVLYRRVNDQWFETKVLNVKKMLNEKDLSEDVELRPGDMIFVPKNGTSKITRFIPSPGVGMGITP